MSLNLTLVSHQQLLRTLLREQLGKALGTDTVLEYPSVGRLQKDEACLRVADLLIVDADLAEGSPLPAVEAVLRFRPSSKIALLTDTGGAYLAESIHRLGLRGLLHKRDPWDLTLQAVNTILAGGIWISPQIDYAGRVEFARVLSAREVEVLALFAQGYGTKGTAQRLKITPATAATHRKHIFRKLGLNSQTALVLFALRSGLVPADQLGRFTGR
jgi:DNA-binding NarL/FixJ family response regulator